MWRGRRWRGPGARWRRGAAALAAGAVPALAFPAPSLWWLAYVALVPLIVLVRSAPDGRRAAVDGWLGGAGFMLAVHHWLLPSLHVFLVVLAALLGLLWVPWGWLVWRLLGGSPGPGAVAAALPLVPSAWLMAELVRSWQYLGGPWGLLGASQWQVAPALRLASVGGVWLLSFLLVAVNTALAALLTLARARTLAVGALALVVAAGAAVWLWVPAAPRGATLRVAVVQPGLIDRPADRFDRAVALTRELAGQRLDLVVWGESSIGFDLAHHPRQGRQLVALSRLLHTDLLVNVDAQGDGERGIAKTAVLVGPDGPTGPEYAKMRLVPFGEYIPLRSALGWATAFGKAAGVDGRRGHHQVVMDVGAARVGPLICFESAFPDMSRHLARMGAQVLVAQSSTSSFQDSWAPAQHASLAALRAAETWRPTVHATLTGISAVFDARGRPVGPRLGTRESAARVYPVPLSAGSSPYVRLGDWVPPAAVALLLAGAAYEGVAAVRRRRPREAGAPRRRPAVRSR
ncbi:apolipoprotein N-acyltransferase [Streptantibioticus cattleyicolor]|uniref:apolipoprotein N-acyltransferase n=1 Tax=Streptomyces sp. SID5468 TaxID=2690295 RepID=UPI001E4FBADA|nr:apolipoprotein N-acyltransferase [Streptantibioticus cattleyicolor]